MAVNYMAWKTLNLSIANLKFDPKNPRLPDEAKNTTQPNIHEALIDNFKVLQIAKSIATKGYFPNSDLIAIKGKKKYIVLEGNRRLAALKLLLDPELAPPRKRPAYRKLARLFKSHAFDTISCRIAPSRKEADPLIYSIHANELIEKWTRLSKHQFIAEPLFSGTPIEDIAAKFDVPESEVKEAVMEILLRQLVLESDWSLEKKEKIASQDFNLSTISRYLTKHFRDTTGIRIVGNELRADIEEKTFTKIIQKMFLGVLSGELKTRFDKGTEAEDKKATINNIFSEANLTPKENGTRFRPQNAKPAAKKNEQVTQKVSRKPVEKLIPKEFSFDTGAAKLNALLEEGQKIRLGSTLNCSGLLLRAILEQATYKIFELNGAADRLIKPVKQKHARNAGQTEDLGKLVRIMCAETDWFNDQKFRIRLSRFADQESTTFMHIETLNGYTHDKYYMPTKDELRNFWGMIEPLVLIVQTAHESENEQPAA